MFTPFFLIFIYIISLIYTFAGYSFSGYGLPNDKSSHVVDCVIDIGMTAILSPLFLIGGILELIFGPLEEI